MRIGRVPTALVLAGWMSRAEAAVPAEATVADGLGGGNGAPGGDGTSAGAVRPRPAPPPAALSALGLFQLRMTRSSVVTTNPFLDGQVVGALGGINGTTTDLEDRSMLVEQRADAFLTWAPPLLDGRASLTAGFEVDFAWGDQAYQTGGNKGGGFGADQVNLQTRRLHASFEPDLGGDDRLRLVAGLQFVADGPHDPHQSGPDALFRHGGGLCFWGSEAAGLAGFGVVRGPRGDLLHTRLGGYSLVENGVAEADDVTLWMADAEAHPAYAWDVAVHAWWLKDNSGGSGGTLGLGPTSQLSDMQGGPRLSVVAEDGTAAEVDADLAWIGADVGYNRELAEGPVGFRGGGFLNAGRLYVTDQPDIDVFGWLAVLELRGRWAAGAGSEARIELLATSPDDTRSDRYTGIVTGNSYGVAGAVWATHGTLLLFSDPRAINRQVAVVADVSNRGQGLLAITSSLGWDPVPDRLTLRGTAAHARRPDGGPLGTEVNGAILGRPLPLLDLSLEAAVVMDARIVDPTSQQWTELPANPWAVILHTGWILL
ncbi:MAG: hypothetical protein D6798_10865 [Deltaproteobacteria bacterium]|nr:MAG: hypothetical protein D6798_10865 [Deltaproteobacteria bacterium]